MVPCQTTFSFLRNTSLNWYFTSIYIHENFSWVAEKSRCFLGFFRFLLEACHHQELRHFLHEYKKPKVNIQQFPSLTMCTQVHVNFLFSIHIQLCSSGHILFQIRFIKLKDDMIGLMYVRKSGHWFELKQAQRKRIGAKVWSVCALIQWINLGYWEIYLITFIKKYSRARVTCRFFARICIIEGKYCDFSEKSFLCTCQVVVCIVNKVANAGIKALL